MQGDSALKHIAPKLNGQTEGSFAYTTIMERWPKILTKTVDHLHCKRQEFLATHGEQVDVDLKAAISNCSELRFRIMTDKPLLPILDNYHDATMWNDLLIQLQGDAEDNTAVTWYNTDWLFAECYLYRKIYGGFSSSRFIRDYDYFFDQKSASLMQHLPQIEEMASHGAEVVQTTSANNYAKLEEMLDLFMVSLWGNRADLSLSGGDESVLEESASGAPKARAQYVLCNQIKQFYRNCLLPMWKLEGDRRIDVVLDNAGIELVGDLILVDALLSLKFADQIVLHGKAYPWFVSDVIKSDLTYVIDQLDMAGHESMKLKSRLLAYQEEGRILFQDHDFWTTPFPYFQMKQQAPDLYEHFQKSKLAIFKGDLNYRKLVGDRNWDYETKLQVALNGFNPCPLLALRTLKAETVVGLSHDTVTSLLEKYDTENAWLVSGQYAVCQFESNN